MNGCSPRPRGWSPPAARPETTTGLLPAPAGMVPASGRTRRTSRPCSPRPRGWSRAAAGAPGCEGPAPRARGDGPKVRSSTKRPGRCSPRPRGWSLGCVQAAPQPVLLPAPAGMVPSSDGGRRRAAPAPRARGDGPLAHALARSGKNCSPRPRGWSPEAHRDRPIDQLLPAPAGMVQLKTECIRLPTPAPRARGDGPYAYGARSGTDFCSPRPRGWSLDLGIIPPIPDLLPAPAGMVPRRPGASCPSRHCSPRPRGWSRAS